MIANMAAAFCTKLAKATITPDEAIMIYSALDDSNLDTAVIDAVTAVCRHPGRYLRVAQFGRNPSALSLLV